MKPRTFCLVFFFVCLSPAYATAMNSLVTADGIEQMEAANLNQELITLIAVEQTCSVSPELLIHLKKAGADDETLRQVILADRYKKPRPARLSAQDIEVLKKAGCSDAMIIRLIGGSTTEIVVDEQGGESVVTRTDRLQPTQEDNSVEDPKMFYINIEKLERN